MSASSLAALQAAVYSLLTGDATLMGLIAGLYDDVPESPGFPYMTIGEAIETPDRTMGQGGHQVLFTLSTYTRDGSTDKNGVGTAGFAAGIAIAAQATALLVNDVTPLVVTGFNMIMVEVETIETSRATDGITRIIDARYRVWIED